MEADSSVGRILFGGDGVNERLRVLGIVAAQVVCVIVFAVAFYFLVVTYK